MKMIKFSRESRLFQSLRIKIILFKKKIQIPRFEFLSSIRTANWRWNASSLLS